MRTADAPMTELSPNVADKIRISFEKQAFMTSVGATLSDLGPGICTIKAPVSDAFAQQHGFAHAGLTFALGDSAAGYAALTVMPDDAEVLTIEMKINLLAPANGSLVATGRVLKPGHRLIVVQADVHAYIGETEKHVAALQGTMIPV